METTPNAVKRVETDIRHEYICDITGAYFNLDKRDVMDYFISSNHVSSPGAKPTLNT